MARIGVSGRRIPAKSQRGRPRPQELLPRYERVKARDLCKGDLIEPNELSGFLRVIGPGRIHGKAVILAKTDDTLGREFFLPSTAIVRLLVQGRSGRK